MEAEPGNQEIEIEAPRWPSTAPGHEIEHREVVAE